MIDDAIRLATPESRRAFENTDDWLLHEWWLHSAVGDRMTPPMTCPSACSTTSCPTTWSPPARRGRASCTPARRCASSTSRATRRSTSCCTPPTTTSSGTARADTIAAQGNLFLRTGSVLRSNEGRPMMTIDRHRRSTITTPSAVPARASRTRCATATTPSASTPASTTSSHEHRAHGLRQARHGVEHQLLHERAGRGRRQRSASSTASRRPGCPSTCAPRSTCSSSCRTARRSTIRATASTRRPCG